MPKPTLQVRNCGGLCGIFGRWFAANGVAGAMYIGYLATDYDGTLAHDGVDDDAHTAFRRSGRSLSWSLGENSRTSCAFRKPDTRLKGVNG